MTDNLAIDNHVDDVVRKNYVKPAIVHELKLEIRAGSRPRGAQGAFPDCVARGAWP